MRNFIPNRFIKTSLVAAASTLAISMPATADDLDVFEAILNSQNKPNILFVLDYSGSMTRDVYDIDIPGDDTETLSKIDILKSAVNTLLIENKGKVNVGLGSYYNWRTSGVRWPISDLEANANTIDPNIPAGDDVTNAEVISSQLGRVNPNHATATVNGLAEAAAYFRGDEVLHSGYSPNEPYYHEPDVWDAGSRSYNGGNAFAAMPGTYEPANAYQIGTQTPGNYGYCTNIFDGAQYCDGYTTYDCVDYESEDYTSVAGADGGGGSWTTQKRTVCKFEHPDTWTTPTYKSPITKQCQANFIVLISDGQPTNLRNTETLQTVLKAAGAAKGQAEADSTVNNCEDLGQTIFLNNIDNQDAGNCGPEVLEYLANNQINPTIEKSQVKTFTVGFGIDGPGKEYLELLADKGEGEFYEATKPEELTTALNAVIDSILAGSQNFAELSIDVDPTTFSHDNRTYFSLFSPSSQPAWNGNLKGFFVDEGGLIDINGDPATFDDGAGIKFTPESHSFWSAQPDGNEVLQGGASEGIVVLPSTRNLYTYLNGGLTGLATNADNYLNSGNTNITAAMMNTTEELRKLSIDWLSNAPMGDPLHTKPVVVNYGTDKKVVYIMTNQGFLHAFDATKPMEPGMDPIDVSGGDEIFAFMPEELLSNVPLLYKNEASASGHIYGLDGAITRWHDDENKDGFVNGTDTVTLVFGMRRGGGAYYALDVTDPEQPSFLWKRDKTNDKFERLAQSWSRPSLVTVNNGGTLERMLMFGGGYDADVVDGTTQPIQSSGNAIFLVNKQGTVKWSIDETDAGADTMRYSIPSDLTVIDTDGKNGADRVYFGDVAGQVWRVDFNDISSKADTTVTKFANLYDGTNHRPIFYAPSVSLNKERGKRYLAVSFGTGDRTQPMMENTQNALYMLKDRNPKHGAPTTAHQTITANICTAPKLAGSAMSCLYNAKDNAIGSADDTISQNANDIMQASDGWVFGLRSGEKALSQVVAFEGAFMATTFEPEAALTESGDIDPCRFDMTGRLYILNVADAQPEGDEPFELLHGTAIPSKPVVTLPPDSEYAQVFVDKESVTALKKKITTVFWHSK